MDNERGKTFWLYIVIAVVALIGLADATYLTVEHLSGRNLQCSIISGCNEVLASPYAKMLGYPVSGYGAAAYFTVFSAAVLIIFNYRILKTPLLIITALMALASIWFLYLQAFVIRHFCQYCLLSAAVSFALFALTLIIKVAEKRQNAS